jgi:hypothetical protein
VKQETAADDLLDLEWATQKEDHPATEEDRPPLADPLGGSDSPVMHLGTSSVVF